MSNAADTRQPTVVIVGAGMSGICMGIKLRRAGEVAWATPKRNAMERFNDDLRAAMPNTVWTTGCDSWYLGSDGVPMLWPWSPQRFKETLREPVLDEFEVTAATA